MSEESHLVKHGMQRERKRTKEQHRRGAERRKEVQRWIWTPSDTDTGGDSGQVGRKDGSPKRRRPGATRDDGCRGQSLDRAGEEGPDDCRKIPVSRCAMRVLFVVDGFEIPGRLCRERGSAPKSSTGGEQSAVRRCKGGYGPRRTQTREVTRARWGARTAAQNDGGQVPQGASEGRSRVPTSSQRRRCVATFWTGCPFEVPRGMTAAGVSLWTEQMQRERKRTKEQHRRGAERRKEVQRWIWTPSDTDTGGDSGQVGRKDGSPKRRRPGAAGSLGGAKPRADERSEKVRRLRCVATFWTGCPFEVPRGMTAAGVSLWTEQMQRERKRTKEQHRRGAERRKEVLQVRTAAGSISGPSS
ncbi:hypothetical protein GRJ2_002356900 [Grus japonensis]|uniref:Uncharacterized protein n=1 Tax=Grus japonensis TaxID=30415 RepID=A0ABC9XPF5_GRUJA